MTVKSTKYKRRKVNICVRRHHNLTIAMWCQLWTLQKITFKGGITWILLSLAEGGSDEQPPKPTDRQAIDN